MYIPADLIWIVVLGFIIAFILAFGIGANDVANSFGTSVGSNVISLRNACILASIFEVLGSILLGAKVSDTIRKGVLLPGSLDSFNGTSDAKLMMLGYFASLSGACVWLLVATFFKLPVSGSHSVVGAIVGFALVLYGFKGINWKEIGLIVASWFISPFFSGLLSIVIFSILNKFVLQKADPLEPGLNFLPFIYGLTIFINVFSILYSGPKLLYFHKIPLYGTFITSIGLSVITIIIAKFALVPYLRKTIKQKLFQAETVSVNCNENTQNHINLSEMTSVANSTKNNDSATRRGTNGNIAIVEENKPETPVSESTKEIIADKPEQVALFSWVQILTAIFGAFAHGGNDVSNAIGPLVGLWILALTQDIHSKMDLPLWILLYGGLGITVGLWVWGRRVMETIGNELTTITPSSGISIELGAAVTVLIASNIGIPISTTHCKVGSIVTVGRFRSKENVDWKLFGSIVLAWVVTLPASGGISALMMYLLTFTL